MTQTRSQVGDLWQVIDQLRDKGWSLILDNRGLGDTLWTAELTDWSRNPEPRVCVKRPDPYIALAEAVDRVTRLRAADSGEPTQ